MKKILAIVVALCLMMSVMAVSASAADNDIVAGASLNLNEGIAIQFLVYPDAVKSYDSTYITVDYLDRDETPLTAKIDAEDYTLEGTQFKRYLFTGVSPDRLDNEVVATLYGVKGGNSTKICELEPYSVKTYIANTYEKTTDSDAELRALLADLLYYGEKARAYTGVSETPLYSGSDWAWVDTTKSSVIDGEDISGVKKLTDVANPHIEWTSVGLNLRENPAILYKFKLTNKASGVSNYKLVVEIEGEDNFEYQLSAADYDKTERCYTYRFRGLNPTKMGEKVSAYFVDGSGNKVSAVLDYSVESFAYFCYTETDGGKSFTAAITKELYELTQALLEYGEATLCLFDGLNIPMSTVTYTLADETDRFYVTGRTEITTSGTPTGSKQGLLYDHAAQGLLFEADCEGDITLILSHDSKGAANTRYFTVYIDGVRQDTVIADVVPQTECLVTVKVATGLSRGKHLIEMYRNNEPHFGEMTLLSLTMRGIPYEWESDPDQIKIEVIGDSISCGNGVTAVNGAEDELHPKHANATLAYPFVVARELGAEVSVVGKSGITNGDTADGTLGILPYYDSVSYYRYGINKTETMYDHSKMAVDLFIIGLGTNDYWANFTDEKIIDDAINTMTAVREDHPNAKVLWVVPPNRNGDLYTQAVEQMGGAKDGYYFYCFETYNNKGGTNHPNETAQQAMGEGLANYIKNNINLG